MTKDPAVLFYTSDFLTGTFTMSNEHTGMYIKLLCLQHQRGRLTERDMINVCLTYVEDVYCKFIKDEDGLYYNKRMEDETNRRRSFCESRRLSRMSNVRGTHVQRMETENINTTSSVCNTTPTSESSNQVIKDTVCKRFVVPGIEDVKAYCVERGNTIDAEKWMDYYRSNGWKVGRNPMKDWKAAVRTWEKSGFREKEMSAYDFTVAEGKKLMARVKAQELAKEKEQKKGEDYVDTRDVDPRVKSLISGF